MRESHRTDQAGTRIFPALRGLAGGVRERIVRSEAEGGLRLGALKNGARVFVQTVNRIYQLQILNGQTWISGHPEFCPQPVPVSVRGSSWGGSMLKVAYLGRGMYMEFYHPKYSTVTTSRIVSIRLD